MSDALERIFHDELLIAIVIRADFHQEGITFVTPDNFSQQLAYMNRPAGHRVAPHVHNAELREVMFTHEVLMVRSGKIRVDLFGADQSYFDSRTLGPGDTIMLVAGGHGVEMLEPAEVIEVKQGPHLGARDKTLIVVDGKEQ